MQFILYIYIYPYTCIQRSRHINIFTPNLGLPLPAPTFSSPLAPENINIQIFKMHGNKEMY
jgi:hypothetical protein